MISDEREPGKHGWRSAAHPVMLKCWVTFSVGIFQWVPRSGGKGVKPGKVLVRVSGLTNQVYHVDKEVAKIIKQLDTGEYAGPKYVRVQQEDKEGAG